LWKKSGKESPDLSNDTAIKIFESWNETEKVIYTTEEILHWVSDLNRNTFVKVNKIPLTSVNFWSYKKDAKGIVRYDRAFFSITGISWVSGHAKVEQPIIIQDEIGYLGIICKEINGMLYFLMQAKIEPGNVNKIQISPTIQATKSNFLKTHGGREPNYLKYFENSHQYEIVADQIQSEQASRFLKKRNRNIIIKIEEDIEVLSSYRWMTLGQIKQLMKYDNLVNMDTRTVISCLPFSGRNFSAADLGRIAGIFDNGPLYNSFFTGQGSEQLIPVFNYINNVRMMDDSKTEIVDLYSIRGWRWRNDEYVCDTSDFKIVFCDIEIQGREVLKWQQPLLEATEPSCFGLIYCICNDRIQFLVRAFTEIGSFDMLELGPSVQRSNWNTSLNGVEIFFFKNLKAGKNITFSGVFSEEGGRFYQEQNRNILMCAEKQDFPQLPDGYFWLDYQQLNIMVQINNGLNIQLRNLLSLLNLNLGKE
jgi:dTDP-4-dehydro-6-deoxy-alpha-D-glucopyranose 2,3-dehydratase